MACFEVGEILTVGVAPPGATGAQFSVLTLFTGHWGDSRESEATMLCV